MSINSNMLKINKSYSAGKQSLIASSKIWSTISTMHTSTTVGPTLHTIGGLAVVPTLIDAL